MSKFKDHTGKESMMRKMTWLIVIVGLAWGTGEVIYSFFNNAFDIHETLIISTTSVGITGKGVQKALELAKGNQNMT